MFKNFITFFSTLVFTTFMFATVCLAGAADTYALHIQDLLQTIIGIVFGAIAGLLAWGVGSVISLVRKKTGLEIDDNIRSYLETALQNGLNWAQLKVLEEAKDIKDPEVKSELLADAANYVLDKVPDAVDHFGLTPDRMLELIEARLPSLYTDTPQ